MGVHQVNLDPMYTVGGGCSSQDYSIVVLPPQIPGLSGGPQTRDAGKPGTVRNGTERNGTGSNYMAIINIIVERL